LFWVAQVAGFLADYQVSARFAPGIVRADFKGHFAAIFNPVLFRCDVVLFLAAGRVYASCLYRASN
jgi:hypothetical protein